MATKRLSTGVGRDLVRRARRDLAFLLICCLAVAPAMAGELPGKREQWIEVKTEHFTIYSNAREGAAKQIGVDLERLRAALEHLFSRKLRSPVPTAIYVFKNDRALSRYKYLHNGKPAAVSGYFVSQPTGNYVAIDGGSARRANVPARNIVYHEYLHEILRNNEPHLPLWMNEGLAEYFSTFEADEGEAKIGLAIPHHLDWLKGHSLLPMEQLLAVDRNSVHYNDQRRAGVFYAQSWALTHYLLLGSKARHGQYAEYGRLLSAGTPHKQAFAEAFQTDLSDLTGEVKKYVRQRRFNYSRISFGDVAVAPTARILDRTEMLYRLGDLAAQLGPELSERAEAHLRAVLQADPEHAPSLARLAVLRLDAGDPTAITQLARAVELAPEDYRVQYLYGAALLKSAVGEADAVERGSLNDDKQNAVKAARRALVRSIKLRPGMHDAWAKLSFVYQLVDRPADEALDVQRTAHRLLPDRYDVTINLANTLAELGRESEARVLLAKLADDGVSVVARAAAREALFVTDMGAIDALVRAEKLDAALAFAEQMVTEARDPRHRAMVRATVKSLNRQVASVRFWAQYAQLVTTAQEGDYQAALTLLEALQSLAVESSERRAVERVREELLKVLP